MLSCYEIMIIRRELRLSLLLRSTINDYIRKLEKELSFDRKTLENLCEDRKRAVALSRAFSQSNVVDSQNILRIGQYNHDIEEFKNKILIMTNQLTALKNYYKKILNTAEEDAEISFIEENYPTITL